MSQQGVGNAIGRYVVGASSDGPSNLLHPAHTALNGGATDRERRWVADRLGLAHTENLTTRVSPSATR